jgi:hypothetical protein
MPESKTPIGRGSDKLEDPEFLDLRILARNTPFFAVR